MAEKMFELARELLAERPVGELTQAVVLAKDTGELVGARLETPLDAELREERALLDRFGGGAAAAVLVLWGDGSVDLPSIALRRLLVERCAENENAGILLLSEAGYVSVPLGNTMK